MHGNQHLEHPKKHKKRPENQKQVSLLADGRIFKGQNREIELISKKV